MWTVGEKLIVFDSNEANALCAGHKRKKYGATAVDGLKR
jgi:hypothetical protein